MPIRNKPIYFLLLVGACALVSAGDSAMDRATLRGLKAIKVVIDRPDPQIERQGITQDQLQSEVADQLRKAGITVDENASEFLGLSLKSARVRRGSYPVALSLGVYQVVWLSRDKTIKTVAETWSAQDVFSVPPKNLNRVFRGTVGELVDQFIRAYRAANPNGPRASLPETSR